MGITDKITGRVKQAAGDLAGNESLRREGLQEERKGEAKDELRRHEEQAQRKQAEVDSLEHKTNPDALAADASREDLYDRAQALDIPGRSEMTKDELAREIARRE
jgi:uncharacterized protein YjbJ (UPF0337 family)